MSWMVWWTCPFSTWYFVFDKCNFVFGITDNGLRELGPGRTSGPHGVVHGPHWVLSPIVDVKARLEFVAAVTRAFLNKGPPPHVPPYLVASFSCVYCPNSKTFFICFIRLNRPSPAFPQFSNDGPRTNDDSPPGCITMIVL